MDAKEFLERPYILKQRVDTMCRRIEELEPKAYRSTRPIDAEAVSGTIDPHARESAIAELADLRTELHYDFEEFKQIRIEVQDAIDKLYPDHYKEHRIFGRRYLLGWTWSRIAREYGLKVSEVHSLHDAALPLIEVPERYRNE